MDGLVVKWVSVGVVMFPFLFCSSSTPCSEEEAGWDTEIKDDVIEECNKHGGVIHIYVDKNSAQVCLAPGGTDLNRLQFCCFVLYRENITKTLFFPPNLNLMI